MHRVSPQAAGALSFGLVTAAAGALGLPKWVWVVTLFVGVALGVWAGIGYVKGHDQPQEHSRVLRGVSEGDHIASLPVAQQIARDILKEDGSLDGMIIRTRPGTTEALAAQRRIDVRHDAEKRMQDQFLTAARVMRRWAIWGALPTTPIELLWDADPNARHLLTTPALVEAQRVIGLANDAIKVGRSSIRMRASILWRSGHPRKAARVIARLRTER